MIHIKKRGDKWLTIDLKSNTVKEFNSLTAAEYFRDNGEEEVEKEDDFADDEPFNF